MSHSSPGRLSPIRGSSSCGWRFLSMYSCRPGSRTISWSELFAACSGAPPNKALELTGRRLGRPAGRSSRRRPVRGSIRRAAAGRDLVPSRAAGSSMPCPLGGARDALDDSQKTRVTWWSILGCAVQVLAVRWRPLLRALLLPACVLTFLGIVKPQRPFSVSVLYSFAEVVIGASFAVATHRVILLGLDLPPWTTLSWSRRETRFAVWWLATGALFAPLAALYFMHDAIESVGAKALWVIIGVATTILAVRLSLILPALAIDQYHEIRKIWSLSRGRVIHLTLALGLPTLGLTLLWLSVPEDPPAMQLATTQVLLGLASSATTVIELAVLSASYRELRRAAAAAA